jgi:monosaccharide-transporting ATPase
VGKPVGLAGLLGSGRSEVAHLVFGVNTADEGDIAFGGTAVRPTSPRDAMKLGIAMTPEDRKAAGIVPNLSVQDNIVLALQASRGIFRRLPARRQVELADRYIKALGIKTPHRDQPAHALSGGNQQKVLLARWLATEPRLFILDEPTRGIDVGAKNEIESLILDLAAEGMSFLFISSELEEVVRLSTRVVVLRDREQIGTLEGEAISEHSILGMIAGDGERPGSRNAAAAGGAP